MVEASANVACIFVDCDWGKKNQELSTKYGIKGYPTVVFCDPQGTSLGRLEAREPDEVAKALQELARRGAGKAADAIAGPDYDRARATARRSGALILMYFADRSPASLSVNEALMDPSLSDLHPRFTFGKAEFVKDSAVCLKFGVTRAPTILILDPKAEKPEEKPLLRIEGSRSVRELRRELESVLPMRDPFARPADLPSVRRDAPEEKLSDDEIERKFIWARVSVAQDALKRGNKDKAIEILEDVLKSYPKHKDTEEVRKVLADIRKK